MLTVCSFKYKTRFEKSIRIVSSGKHFIGNLTKLHSAERATLNYRLYTLQNERDHRDKKAYWIIDRIELVTIPGGKLLNGFVKTPTLVGDMHHDFHLTAVVGSCQAAKRDQAVALFWVQAAAVSVRSGGLGRDLEAGTEVGCNFVKFARELTHRFMMNFFDSEIKEILLNQGNRGS